MFNLFKNNRGFTFIELIVVIAIFSIMAGVVIFNARDFGDNIALQNLAQDIALKLKTAQNNGSSGKASFFGSFSIKPSYGLHFDVSSSSEKKQFSYFADLNNNGYMDSLTLCTNTQGVECLDKIGITGGDVVDKLCVNQKSSVYSPSCSLLSIDITFTRPNLNADIKSLSYPRPIDDAEIVIVSPKGVRKTIVIWPTGQISVE